MEIKIGEKYLWEPYGDVVTVIAGPDSDGDYCARDADDSFVILSSRRLKPLRTPKEVERDKITNEVSEVSKMLNATGEPCRLITEYILENYVHKDDPRVVEPLDLYYYTSAMKRNATPSDCFNWLKDNKHICVKED